MTALTRAPTPPAGVASPASQAPLAEEHSDDYVGIAVSRVNLSAPMLLVSSCETTRAAFLQLLSQLAVNQANTGLLADERLPRALVAAVNTGGGAVPHCSPRSVLQTALASFPSCQQGASVQATMCTNLHATAASAVTALSWRMLHWCACRPDYVQQDNQNDVHCEQAPIGAQTVQ